jgi:hypothetical protein
MDAALQLLLERLSTLDVEEYGWLRLESATWANSDVILHLVVHQQDQPDQSWLVHCHHVRNSKIRNDQAIDSIQVETEHPLLLPHLSPIAELYFHGRPAHPDAAVGQLVEAHRSLLEDWFDCMHFFNLGLSRSLRQVLESGFGLLAKGPSPLIELYAQVLQGHEVSVSSPPSRQPAWWNDGEWIQEKAPLFALIFGKSYVVASAITAEKR